MSVIAIRVIGGDSVMGGDGIIGRGVISGDVPPPSDTFRILTEDGNVLTTEGGNPLETEQ